MNTSQPLSIVMQNYVTCFCRILDTMITDMTQAPLTQSISHNFIVQMIPHHRAAIEMSQNLLQYTTCIPLQEIALGIVSAQTQSIADMEQVLGCCGTASGSRNLRAYTQCFDRIARVMFTDMKQACTTNDINATFMREMIPHHKGAVRMSENALRFPICPELVPILNAIISSQKKGICEMERLLQSCPYET